MWVPSHQMWEGSPQGSYAWVHRGPAAWELCWRVALTYASCEDHLGQLDSVLSSDGERAVSYKNG